MSYLSIETVTASLNDANWAANGDANLSVMLANAWLAEKRLPNFEIVPADVLMAGALIARAYADEEMYQTEPIVTEKKVKADSVEVAKKFATGDKVQSQAEQQALLLIAPYLVVSKGYRQMRVARG